MDTIDNRVKRAVSNTPARDPEKLKRQQAYYNRLEQAGLIEKQTYNLKSSSSI